MNRYKNAIKWYKKILKISTDNNLKDIELDTYHNLSILYYYEGDMKHAKHYNSLSYTGAK